MNSEEILYILASRKEGTTKKEFFSMCKIFNVSPPEYEWLRMINRKNKGASLPIYLEGKKWYSFEKEYYKSLVEFVNDNPKEKTDMGMAMGPVPTWIRENHDLFIKSFKKSDY